MPIFTIQQAKASLSKLIAKAEAGEEVVIARGGEPSVKLVPVPKKYPKRKPGAYKGEFTMPDGFFDPLPEEARRGGGCLFHRPDLGRRARGRGQEDAQEMRPARYAATAIGTRGSEVM